LAEYIEDKKKKDLEDKQRKDEDRVRTYSSKIELIAKVEQDGRFLARGSAELKADKKVVLAAVSQFGNGLLYASDELKVDHEVVRITLVTMSGWGKKALKFEATQARPHRQSHCQGGPGGGEESEAIRRPQGKRGGGCCGGCCGSFLFF
jgi:hypothetical protein